MAAVFLFQRLFYRVWQFLVHWYGHGFLNIGRFALSALTRLDKRIALRITLRYFWQPLYQDYTTLGYILGFFFRTWRVILGAIVYAILLAVFLAVYAAWALIPIYLLLRFIYL